MIKRLEDGEDAIDLSIEKWKDIARIFSAVIDFVYDKADRHQLINTIDLALSSDNSCALCHLYLRQRCIGCPLYEIGDKCIGGGSSTYLTLTNPTQMIEALNRAKAHVNKNNICKCCGKVIK